MTDVALTRDVPYGSVAGRPLMLDILEPASPTPGLRPAILEIHGGAWREGNRDASKNHHLAAHGFFTVSVSYRLSGEATFPAQIHDVKAAVRWLRANHARYRLDPERIGVWGGSAGGHLAALLGTSAYVADLEGTSGSPRYTSHVQAVVAICPPTDPFVDDWPEARETDSPFAQVLGGPLAAHASLARLMRPSSHITSHAPPFLILHGTEDELVPVTQSQHLYNALTDAGVEASFVPMRGGNHSLEGFWDEIAVRQLAFFQEHLMAQRL